MIVKSSDKTPSFSWLILLVFLFSIVWLNSIIGTTNIANWFIENTLTVISLLFLISTYKSYRFNTFSYSHCSDIVIVKDFNVDDKLRMTWCLVRVH
jgi:uncharacterized membrane protein YjdF